MKYFRYLLMALAFVLMIYNATQLDFDNLWEGDSLVALIGIIAAACVIILIGILNTSLKISKKQRGK